MAISIVDGIPLKEFLFRTLSYKSIRDCILDEEFKKKTGIVTKYALEKEMKTYKISTETLYRYSISNKIIPYSTTFEEFKNNRRNEKGFVKTKTSIENFLNPKEEIYNKKELIKEILESGFYSDENMSINEIVNLHKLLIKEE